MTLIGIANGQSVITVEAGGQAAQRKLGVVPDVTGTWTGELVLTTCNRISGVGPTTCKTPEFRYRYRMAVTEHRGRDFRIETDISNGDLRGSGAGHVAEDGTVRIVAHSASASNDRGITKWEFSEAAGFVASRTGLSDQLFADLVVERSWTNNWGAQLFRDKCTLSLTRLSDN